MTQDEKKICPLLALPWANNVHTLKASEQESSDVLESIPKCYKEKCQFWSVENDDCGLKASEPTPPSISISTHPPTTWTEYILNEVRRLITASEMRANSKGGRG